MSDSPETTCCGCHADGKRTATDPAYQRALWIVILLNLRSVVEVADSSRAVKPSRRTRWISLAMVPSRWSGFFALAWAEHTCARLGLRYADRRSELPAWNLTIRRFLLKLLRSEPL